ncbi:MAG TPA: neuraminidase-like domain-containing protein [Terriglobales bacterium]|nr:neuraminidase-like domain-containing protein [Terriglobales bacterium]
MTDAARDYSPDQIKQYLVAHGHATPKDIDFLHSPRRKGTETQIPQAVLATHARLYSVTSDINVSHGLIQQGISSAAQIAMMPRRSFVSGPGKALGASQQQASAMHARAVRVHNRTMQMFAATHSAVTSTYFRSTRVANVSDELVQQFEKLPSYQDLFGSLNFCACDECKSIFGPAAYLVDLLRITDRYITTPNKGTIPAAFLLQSRRPDLWKLPLTCAMTNNTLPYLQIVNERLMDAVQSALQIQTSDALLQQMATSMFYPLNLPFNHPLDRVRVLLQQIKVPLGDIYAAWGVAADAVVRERLGLSLEQLAIVKNTVSDPGTLAKFYGVPAASLSTLAQVGVFMQQTGLAVKDVIDLIQQNMSATEITAGVPQNLFINQGLGAAFLKLSSADDQSSSTIQNMSNTALDQINRLRRLAATLGWSVETTDWCVRAVKPGKAPAIDADALAGLERVNRLAAAFNLSPIQASVFFGPIKTYGGDGTDPVSLFDRLFNDPSTLSGGSDYHPSGNSLNSTYTDTPLSWQPGSKNAADIASITRVAPGLGLTLPAANALGAQLFGTTSQQLTVDVLSSLYRHALLSQALNLPMDQYLILLSLQGITGKNPFAGPDLDSLVAAWQWMNTAGLDLYTLNYILQATPSVFVDPLFQDSAVTPWLQGLVSTIPDLSAPTAEATIMQQVAVFFSVSVQLATVCMQMAIKAVPVPDAVKTLPPVNVKDWIKAFLAANTPYADYVTKVLRWVSRWLVFAQQANLTAELLNSVATYAASYGLPADFSALPWAAAQGIERFAALTRQFGDRRGNLLQYVALSQPPAQDGDANALAKLADATGWDPSQVTQLLSSVVVGIKSVPERLQRLKACFGQISTLGADVAFMQGIVGLATNQDWNVYLQQAALCQSKVSGRYGQNRWQQLGGQVEGKLQVNLRDALVGLELAALRATYKDIQTPNNVYEFLLTDVETGPEAQISYIKEALNAVQLYLQRCRLRLEPGVEILDEIPPIWWDWMLNYRVWEANRRIFLYPENYLLPSLRRDQTSVFRTLSSDLRQSDITSDYVESVYNNYMDGFGELARLKPVDSYRCTVEDPKKGKIRALYLLARTETAPFTFFLCRQLEATPWTEWEKIDLTINAPSVTLVYAFTRLFVFWVEVKSESTPSIQVGTTGGQTNNNQVYRATIQYSFQNHQGKWVPAQTLAKDIVVLFTGQGTDAVKLTNDPLFNGCFDLDSIPWSKVFAVSVTGANWPGGNGPISDSDRIVVSFGPYVRAEGVETPPIDQPTNRDAVAFVNNLKQRVFEHTLTTAGRLSGELPVNGYWVLDSGLQSNFVGHNAEFILLDPYVPGAPLSSFAPNMDDLSLQVQLVRTTSPISANYTADLPGFASSPAQPTQVSSAFFATETVSNDAATKIYNALIAAQVLDQRGNISATAMANLDLTIALGALLADGTINATQLPGILDVLLRNLGSPVLFSSATNSNAQVFTVKNQPGWFVFNNGDEMFLLEPQPGTAFGAINESLLVSQPPLNSNSFVVPDPANPSAPKINGSVSVQIFNLMQSFSLVDARGIPDFASIKKLPKGLATALANLQLSDDQLAMVNGIVYNYPVIFSDTFVSSRISKDVSLQIYTLMQQFSLIDRNNRLHLDMVTSTLVNRILANLVMKQTILQKDVAAIYRTVVRTPVAFTFSYWNPGDASSFSTLSSANFTVTRLTTSAIQPMSRALFTGGIDRLLSLDTQNIPAIPVLPFGRLGPSTSVAWPGAIDGAQVDFDGLYGQYFWEVFYHGPMLVANSLAANLQFREAISWFQYVFNPTVQESFITSTTFSDATNQAISPQGSAEALTTLQSTMIGNPSAPIVDANGRVNPALTPTTNLGLSSTSFTPDQMQMVTNVVLNYQLAKPSARFWRFRPFRTYNLETLRAMLTDGSPAVQAYENDPFNPFAIARLRIGAFEKATVMQYIDTLLNWGDYYFGQDTWEAIVAATMVYVYAYNLLGPRPQQVGVCEASATATYADIVQHYKDKPVPEFLIDLETMLPSVEAPQGEAISVQAHAFNDLGTYFCVPENDVFISYWDRVEDRLNKIRHSQDIHGRFRLLALFEPPIDPLALIRAAGATNNFLTAGGGAANTVPPYRFQVALDRARRLASTAAQLGTLLQSALEAKDGEALALLRNTQEAQILALTTQMKQSQITRMSTSVEALKVSQQTAKAQIDFYTNALSTGLIPEEQLNLDASATGLRFTLAANILKTSSAIGYAVPQAGSPFAMTYGGQQIGAVVDATAGAAEIGAEISAYVSQRALTMAGYQRRTDDWNLAKTVAQNEYDSLTQQIAAAAADLATAQQDLVIHKKAIAQNKETDDFLAGKFTNEDLYLWTAGRLSALYYQSYQLAVQSALSAQKSFQYEMDNSNTFINFDYWDSAHKGLRAADGLLFSLDQIESAYAQGNTRRLEIERTISLAALDPLALDALKTTGTCNFEFPEIMFDYDYPGHYVRKIQSLSMSIPAIVGPYQNIRASLTQNHSYVAATNDAANVKYLLGLKNGQGSGNMPSTVWKDWQANNRQIAVSHGMDDSGVFQLDFHDERYLPFEGTGAVSSWTLELPRETNHFDFNQLSDVIITLRYTALEDDGLKTSVRTTLSTHPLDVGYYLSVQQSFGVQWQSFLADHSQADSQTLQFNYTPAWLGYLLEMDLVSVSLRLTTDSSVPLDNQPQVKIGTLTWDKTAAQDIQLTNGLATVKIPGWKREPAGGPWKIVFDLKQIRQSTTLSSLLADGQWFDPAKLLDVELLFDCKVKLFSSN